MKFPNAAKGVKKLFTAQILEIVSLLTGICAVVMTIVTLINAANANEEGTLGFALGTGGFAIAGAILSVIAFIIMIVGLVQAGKDNQNFKTALAFVVIGIAAVVAGSGLQEVNPTLYHICQTVDKIAELVTTCYVIQGIMSLADWIGNPELLEKGRNIFRLIAVIFALSIIGMISYTLILLHPALAFIGYVIMCVSLLLSVIAYILYISLLAKARKVLAA